MGKQGVLFAHNSFTYCKNSPVCYSDKTGHFWKLALVLLFIVPSLTACSDDNSVSVLEYNCYAYVVGRKVWMLPGGNDRLQKYRKKDNSDRIHQDYFDVYDTANAVIGDLGEKNVKIVGGIDAAVPDGWHMIALRTGCTVDSEGYVTVKSSSRQGDFHFMRLDNGIWSHKRGSLQIECLEAGETPESDGVWDPMYTSDIVYMIVRDDWQ